MPIIQQAPAAIKLGHAHAWNMLHQLAGVGWSFKGRESDAFKDADWLAVAILKMANTRPLLRTTQRIFRDQQAEALRNFDRLYTGLKSYPIGGVRFAIKADTPDVLAHRLFDVTKWKTIVAKKFGGLVLSVIEQGFASGELRSGATGLDFTSDIPQVRDVLAKVLAKTKGINDTVVDQLASTLQDGLVQGELEADLRNRVAHTWDVALSRAATIARTAATPAFEEGQVVAYKEAGITDKRWLSQRDDRVRGREQGRGRKYDHYAPDGQTVKLKAKFTISGEKLAYPGDPSNGVSAGNVINCRCTSQPIL